MRMSLWTASVDRIEKATPDSQKPPVLVKCLSPCKSGRAGRDACYATILFRRRLVVLRFMNTDSRWNGSPNS